MKKFLAIILTLGLVMSSSAVSVFAANDESTEMELSYTPKAPSNYYSDVDALLLHGDGEEDAITVYSTIIVNVSSPCDEEWRAKYPDTWMYEANRAIEDADELMRNEFNIDLRSVSQKYWDSNDNASIYEADLLHEAWNEWGTSGADLMIAFTGQTSNWGGWGYVLGSGSLIYDQGYEANACVVRHETGHNYGCDDHYDDATPYPYDCVMNDSYNQYDDLCSTCYSTWYANRNIH